MVGRANTLEDFWQRVPVQNPDACWPFMGRRDSDGYGLFWMRRQRWRAHRLAWVAVHGQPEPHVLVLHGCDNPACCNPAHLHRGSTADNNAERAARGRSATGDRHPFRLRPELVQGERNGRAKLTAAQVQEIRRRYRSGGVYQYELAAEYGVWQSTIGRIVRGDHWPNAPLLEAFGIDR